MDELIAQLDAVRSTLGTISIISTRRNLDALLASMQTLDRVIDALQRQAAERQENANNGNDKQ